MSAVLDFDQFTLTADQQTALDAFNAFLMDPNESVFVLRGYSGCGKSTLVRTLLDRLPTFMKTAKLINPATKDYAPELTATTNKAAENLAQITGMAASTIHSYLGLRVNQDFKTGVTKLSLKQGAQVKERTLLFIDEASFADAQLLKLIFQQTRDCKIVFIGDPAQLTPVKSSGTPVFELKYPGAALTQVVRQADGNPIVDLSTKFRHTVNTGEFFQFTPDGHHVQHMSRQDFEAAIEAEFTRPDWRYADSKILGWTNKCVISFNQFVRSLAKGDPAIQVGDYAVNNSFVQMRSHSIKTDALVQVTKIGQDAIEHDVLGNWFQIDHVAEYFMPKTRELKNQRLRELRAVNDLHSVSQIESNWIDLRAAYACTVNKAQGSTFDKVFIDLDDISRCHIGDQVARMLYVAVSRARSNVFLVGDLA